MQRRNIVILSTIGIALIISLIAALNFSVKIDHRKKMAIDLISNPDGSLNYKYLENLLNEKYMSGVGFKGIVEFVTNYGGTCTEKGCRLPVVGTFCFIENAIISLHDTGNYKMVKVEGRPDGC
ncbi:hypothetical protein [Neptunomonas phycophila]|uniref:hypothetical protein n=1 Tax=Neptunomonas phycophila TaxID=1572645 RepID=UPI000948DB8F|nr:hypothetical protein [Neptunomonas phycophila]